MGNNAIPLSMRTARSSRRRWTGFVVGAVVVIVLLLAWRRHATTLNATEEQLLGMWILTEEGKDPYWAWKLLPDRTQLEAYEALCAKIGEDPAIVVLAWLLANPVVTAPIIGPRTMDQLTGSMRAIELKLSPETMTQLDKIFPGPGGEAPKAYAW